MSLEKISDTVYADISGTNGGNYGAIVLENEIVFVDSGMFHHITSESVSRLKKELNLKPTKMILTHYHSDHIFGAQALGDISIISSVETYDLHVTKVRADGYMDEIREWAEESKNERPDYWKAVQTLYMRVPSIIFNEELFVGSNLDLKIKKLGGHTAGSSIVELKNENIAFIGDLIFNHSFPYAGDPSANPDQWIVALEEIRDANYSKIIPGHGELCDNDVIIEHIEFLKNLRTLVTDALNEGINTTEFLKQERYPDFYLTERSKQRVQSTIETWYAFYKERM